MTIEVILEYAAFGGSLCSAYLYGKQGYKGSIAGILTCFLFMAFGLYAGIYAAIMSNVVFFVIHVRNLRRVYMNDVDKWKLKIAKQINDLADKCFQSSYAAGWWHARDGSALLIPDDPTRGVKRKPVHEFVVPTKLCLGHSEKSEAMEGDRKDAMDDKLPHRSQIEVELADSVIRDLDLAAGLGYDIGGAIAEKMSFNTVRPDHKIENRRKPGGKKY